MEIGPKMTVGDYYVMKNKKSEFIFEANTVVEAIGITREHFMGVLDKHTKKKEGIVEKSNKSYLAFKEKMVLCVMDSLIEKRKEEKTEEL